ncbi:sodium:solute symporter [Sphingobacteriales bacterium UPWRP_1]|nr:sodium:solute symporter [Sphingobacteriales bacterium TSM_CSM]PSJ73691.1 sodium:solute symporter [Sphingobacteriales bacterium UPWRP_1]
MSPVLILSVVGIYFLALFIIAMFTGKDAGNQAFFIGNKQSPWYLVAFGMIGASLSGVTFISIPGAVGNLSAANPNAAFSYMQLAMGYVVGYFVIATVLMPVYYRLNLISIYTYLEHRFGYWTYKTGAFFFLLSRTIGSAFRLYLVAMVMQLFVFDAWGVHFAFNVSFILLLIWLYTLRGGIRTIVFTDTFQTVFLLLSLFSAIYFIATQLNYNLSQMVTTISNSPYGQLFFWDVREKSYFFKQFIGGAFIAITMTGLDQDLMQKNLSCRNLKEAQRNMFTFSGIILLVNLVFVSLGVMLYLYAQAKGIAIPEKTDQLFPVLAFQHFPPVMGILFLLGLTAATYASTDSALAALTTSFCIDFLNFEKRSGQIPEKQLVRTRHLVHVGFSALFVLVVLVFKYFLNDSVINAVFTVAGYTYGPLLGLYAFGLFVPGRQLKDNLVPAICVASPIVCYFLNLYSAFLLSGYKFGFELLIVNGLLTFAGLWLISTPIKPGTQVNYHKTA